MILLISPAKKMREDSDFLEPRQAPRFLRKTEQLLRYLQGLSYEALKKLLACNDGIARQNFERFREMKLAAAVTPALLSYDGIQYQYMAPSLFSTEQFAYAERSLRILSGFYGILNPFDGVVPYRLEMQARLQTPFCKSLYDFWGPALYESLEEEVVVNLASEEYGRAVRPYAGEARRFITPVFGEWENGRVVEKGVYVKMARGEMVRFLAERQAADPEELKAFQGLGYRYCGALSQEERPVFLKGFVPSAYQ